MWEDWRTEVGIAMAGMLKQHSPMRTALQSSLEVVRSTTVEHEGSIEVEVDMAKRVVVVAWRSKLWGPSHSC
jgi:hypothetical protein